MDAAAECSVRFWARCDQIRSEAFKNRMLNLIPELRWAGVNFFGGIATVSISERMVPQKIRPTQPVSSVLASRPGIIVSMSILDGQPVCRIGKAVKAGELLVTGCIEYDNRTQYTCADEEIYALTEHRLTCVVPPTERKSEASGRKSQGLSLIFGKNKIKLFGNSGISGAGCDKMTEVHMWTLPGGYALPVGIAWDTYTRRETEAEKPDLSGRKAAEIIAEKSVLSHMAAGEILNRTIKWDEDPEQFQAVYSCREMISRQKQFLFFEGEGAR